MKVKLPEPALKPFLKARDLAEDVTVVVIEGVREAELPSTGRTYIVKFRKLDKELPLNVTNLRMLVQLFGDETDNWIGKRVKLVKVPTRNPRSNEVVDGLRINKV